MKKTKEEAIARDRWVGPKVGFTAVLPGAHKAVGLRTNFDLFDQSLRTQEDDQEFKMFIPLRDGITSPF